MGKKRKLHVRTGDMVAVVAGNARGARGRIIKAMPTEGRVVIEGVNLVWKHLKPTREHPTGGRIQVEAPIDASNVMHICPNRDCVAYDKPVRIRRVFTPEGNKIRVCARCGAEIPRAE